ncbi:hypothetical protein HQQ94_10255 [Shewanella sp. VB17]|uniref:hypothetical protein n=1 Tax=Shewanella sp. VB17 TaxID=2739432 RepID=UPI00156703E7|nr:hypothetical protein [Shewanella sp. VB17]NRD73624.1 hypothetical protein [Shewanella sp. VB17]
MALTDSFVDLRCCHLISLFYCDLLDGSEYHYVFSLNIEQEIVDRLQKAIDEVRSNE